MKTKNGALRTPRTSHSSCADPSGDINVLNGKPREKFQLGKNTQSATHSHIFIYSTEKQLLVTL
jgi:hypothetical protein